jgi:hypothetical protein
MSRVIQRGKFGGFLKASIKFRHCSAEEEALAVYSLGKRNNGERPLPLEHFFPDHPTEEGDVNTMPSQYMLTLPIIPIFKFLKLHMLNTNY